MNDNTGGNDAGGTPESGFDIASLLTSTAEAEPGGQGGVTPGSAQGANAGQGGVAQGYKFGGRTFKSQQDAEKSFNQLYGNYSKGQEILNALKGALKDPKRLEAIRGDEQMAGILAKLGIQDAEDEVERDREADPSGRAGDNLPPEMREHFESFKVERAGFALDREEYKFERKLGRPVTDEEHNATMLILSKAPGLSYEDGYTLAHHKKILDEAVKAKGGGGQPGQPARPRPIPGIPGTKLDLKKNVKDMNAAEWRENLRNSDELRNLMSR